MVGAVSACRTCRLARMRRSARQRATRRRSEPRVLVPSRERSPPVRRHHGLKVSRRDSAYLPRSAAPQIYSAAFSLSFRASSHASVARFNYPHAERCAATEYVAPSARRPACTWRSPCSCSSTARSRQRIVSVSISQRAQEAPVRRGEMVDSARRVMVFEIRGQDAAKLDEFYRGLFPIAMHHIRTDPATNPGSFRSALPAVGTQSSR